MQLLFEYTGVTYSGCSCKVFKLCDEKMLEDVLVRFATGKETYVFTHTATYDIRHFLGCRIPFYSYQFVPIVDADSKDHLEKARDYLSLLGIETAVIESSPGHYWIIMDRVRPFSDAINLMKQIPFNDDRYIKLCESCRSMVVLRAFPKNGFIPKVIDSGKLKNEHAMRLVDSVVEHFESKFVEKAAKILSMVPQPAVRTVWHVRQKITSSYCGHGGY